MQNKVRWTSSEQEKLAVECVRLMSQSVQFRDVTKITSSDIENYKGFFFDIFSPAQNVLPDARRRSLASHVQAPWLIPAMTKYIEQVALGGVEAPAIEPDQMKKLADYLVSALADKVSDLVVEKLSKQYNLVPRTENVKHNALPQQDAKVRKPSVVIVGLAANQQADVQQAWGTKFELVWADGRTKVCGTRSFAALMVEHVSPVVKAKYMAEYGHRCKLVHGATSSLKKVLNDMHAICTMDRRR